ncbi:MAG: methyltransferase domain-containing protein [Acidobacteria bacterium]|nr:methyltransferase domain-containing protein [Acidobacteriota bacterium]
MTTAEQIAIDRAAQDRDALMERLLQSAVSTFSLFAVHIGSQLGFYRALAAEPLTATTLVARTNTHERYVREWLEQQTVAGILKVEDLDSPADERRFTLPEGHREVLADRESLNYLAPLAQITVGALSPLDKLIAAFRNGGGVAYEDYGADLVEGQAGMNRAAFLYQLGQEWLPAISDVHERLQAEGARIADLGCGAGWSSIGMANSYPSVRVDGFDLAQASVELVRKNVAEAGLSDRVRMDVRDAGDPELAGKYDLVVALECIHDMSDPVSALRAMKRLAKTGGAVIVMDEKVGEAFTPAGNEIEPLIYGFSVFHCLPVGMAEQPSVGTGTVMRPDTLRGYAQQAGFREVEILPIDTFFFRFYRLR